MAACGGSPSPETPALAWDEPTRRALAGATLVEEIEDVSVRGETSRGFRVGLEAERCFWVVGAGDERIRGMTLTVFDPTGAKLGREKAADPNAMLTVCAKMNGPHRIAVEVDGHGAFRVAIYAMSATPPPPAAACADVGADVPFQRLVRGSDRGCSTDADCIAVKIDCSHLRCSGVHKSRRADHSAPIDCRGYTGPMGNYDCDPQFAIEAPRCSSGCCTSERVSPP